MGGGVQEIHTPQSSCAVQCISDAQLGEREHRGPPPGAWGQLRDYLQGDVEGGATAAEELQLGPCCAMKQATVGQLDAGRAWHVPAALASGMLPYVGEVAGQRLARQIAAAP